MTATPAQVANDMAAQAKFWRGRDDEIETICRISASIIRIYVAGNLPDGHELWVCFQRLNTQLGRFNGGNDPQQIRGKLLRARQTIADLSKTTGCHK